jgi:K+ transporter
VTQNGIVLFGVAALLILFWSHGEVSLLVVLYSINVFITFTLTLLGLCVYWATKRREASAHWRWRLFFSLIGFIVTSSILVVTLLVKFTEGGWFTVIITSVVILLCVFVKQHYTRISKKLQAFDAELAPPLKQVGQAPLALSPQENTAVFFVGDQLSVAVHTLLWAMRLFPGYFKNYLFVSVGVVDIESFSGQQELKRMQEKVQGHLDYLVNYCTQSGLPAKQYAGYGTDIIEELSDLCDNILKEFPNCIFFTSKLIFEKENWLIRLLHNETAVTLQRRLHAMGQQLIILPMKI